MVRSTFVWVVASKIRGEMIQFDSYFSSWVVQPPPSFMGKMLAPWGVKQLGYHPKGTSIFPMIVCDKADISSYLYHFFPSLQGCVDMRTSLPTMSLGTSQQASEKMLSKTFIAIDG